MRKQQPPAKKVPAAPKLKAVVVYAVQRVTFGGEGLSDGEPERVFADEKAARKYAKERARAYREYMNPFYWGGSDLIRGGEKKLTEVVTKLGLKPPTRKKSDYYTDWSGWWDRNYPDMTEAQRDAIWAALDRLKLYQVVKTTLEG